MIVKLIPNEFRKGDEVYLLDGIGCCLVTIIDCYKRRDRWFYSINCDNYLKGLELENVPETALSKKGYATKGKIPITTEYMDMLIKEYEDNL